MATGENKVQAEVLTALVKSGLMCWRNNNTAQYDAKLGHYRAFNGMKGVPDILCILPDGVFCGVECKTQKGVVSADQLLFKKRATKLGARVIVARSVEDVKCLMPPPSPGLR